MGGTIAAIPVQKRSSLNINSVSNRDKEIKEIIILRDNRNTVEDSEMQTKLLRANLRTEKEKGSKLKAINRGVTTRLTRDLGWEPKALGQN